MLISLNDGLLKGFSIFTKISNADQKQKVCQDIFHSLLHYEWLFIFKNTHVYCWIVDNKEKCIMI